MREIARNDERRTRKALPLFGATLKLLLHSFNHEDLRSYRDHAIVAIGGNTGARSATIVGIRMEDVIPHDLGHVIELRNEKTAYDGRSISMVTPHALDPRLCAPCTVHALVVAMNDLGLNEGPLFRSIDQWGTVESAALVPKSITAIIRRRLGEAAIPNPNTYSSHSFRHGVVAAGRLKGWTDEQIMLVTMHRTRRGLGAYESPNPWHAIPKEHLLDAESATPASVARMWNHDK
jgi:integrase